MPPEILTRLTAMGTGGFADALIGNLIFLVGRWADLFVTVRFPKVLGMFVLGLWTVRQGITDRSAGASPAASPWRAARMGDWAAARISLPPGRSSAWPYLPPSPRGLLGGRAGGRFPAARDRLRVRRSRSRCSTAARAGSVRPGRPDGVDELPDPLGRLRHAVVRLRVWAVVAHRRGAGVGASRWRLSPCRFRSAAGGCVAISSARWSGSGAG